MIRRTYLEFRVYWAVLLYHVRKALNESPEYWKAARV